MFRTTTIEAPKTVAFKEPRFSLLAFLLALACLSLPVAAETSNIYLSDLGQELGFQLQWDPVSSRGILQRADTYVSFFPGLPFMAINFQRIVSLQPLAWGEGGQLVVPGETADRLRQIFPPRGESSHRISAIVIDPGHGGKDPGAIGRHQIDGNSVSLMEKDLVLDVSLRLYNLLRARYPDIDIVMTRDDDTYLELIDRYEMANSIVSGPDEAVLFVSVHANASINTKANGFEVWYLPPEFRRTLITEKDFEGKGEVVPILNSMLEEEYTIQSILLGRNILAGLESGLDGKTPNRGLKQEIFAVVRGARMPSVLVEIGFLTNQDDFRLLQQPDHLQDIAQGIYNGLNDFINSFEQ